METGLKGTYANEAKYVNKDSSLQAGIIGPNICYKFVFQHCFSNYRTARRHFNA